MGTPIIIVGAARSGTKFLRDLLASADGVKAVPYDVNYVWRYGVPWDADDRLDPARISVEQADFIRKMLPRLAKLRDGEILIEKTVATTLRVAYAHAVYPHARFVHLTRDGRDVVESSMRQWEAAPDWRALFTKLRGIPFKNIDYALWFAGNMISGLASGRKGGRIWGPRYPGINQDALTKSIVELCSLQWKHSVRIASHELSLLPEEQVFNIRYESLVSSPDALAKLISGLGLPDRDSILAAYAKSVKPGRKERWKELPEEEQTRMIDIIKPTLNELGYS